MARYLYYRKTYWKRNLRGWNGSRTKGGEPFATDEKPAQQEGSETVHQRKRETHHTGGINVLHLLEQKMRNTILKAIANNASRRRITQYELLGNCNSNDLK